MTLSNSDSPTGGAASRAALVRGQGVSVSAADEARIQRIADGIAEALLKTPLPSLYDTEPAHFERGLMTIAAGHQRDTRALS